MKKILIVPGNLFVSRNYFSSPLIENLKRISIKDEIKIIVAEVEGNPINDDSFERLPSASDWLQRGGGCDRTLCSDDLLDWLYDGCGDSTMDEAFEL